jgi:hypothetical protein
LGQGSIYTTRGTTITVILEAHRLDQYFLIGWKSAWTRALLELPIIKGIGYVYIVNWSVFPQSEFSLI